MKKIKDPHKEREALKYPNPIPSREFIMEFLRKRGKPATRVELVEALALEDEEQQEALRRRLRAMERDGQLIFTRRGGYGLIEKMDLIPGRVIGHKDGFGFVVPDDGSTDLFLNGREMRAVFDGDRVLVRVLQKDKKGRREAALVEVLERARTQLVGRYFLEKSVGFVVPESKRISQDIIIPQGNEGGANPGQYVVVDITVPPTFRTQAIGSVIEVLGDHMAPGMEIDVVIRSYGLPHEWSAEIQSEVALFNHEVTVDDVKGRVDLRSKPFVTIDGEDAKDFDDAVYCETRPKGGWRLYVAIADVSHYVKPGTLLDEEALTRGTSVYFPGYVIPMLPEELSNNLCSLKEKVDRLAMVCEMQISPQGQLSKYTFYEAVICSKARLTYTKVAAMLTGDKKLQTEYKQLFPHVKVLDDLYQTLHARRKIRGALDFETIETKIIFGEGRKVEAIVPVARNQAHRIIEECMLMANVAAARFVIQHEIAVLFRVHEVPTVEKITEIRAFLGELGLGLRGNKVPKPLDYANLLREIAHRPDASLIQTVLLRSLKQAIYTPENKGHFGLAYQGYTHFTSPIRRYPDLLLHRAIRHILQKPNAKAFKYDYPAMEKLGEHCSVTERRADEAARDALDWLKCEYMQSRVGQEFSGIITNAAHFGIFVELKDIFVEGLVHVTALKNDYYHFDAIRHCLVGERTRSTYRLGDTVHVRVAQVDLEARKIDLVLVDAETTKPKKSKSKRSKKRK